MRSGSKTAALQRLHGHGNLTRTRWADFDDDELRDIASDLSYYGLEPWRTHAWKALKRRHSLSGARSSSAGGPGAASTYQYWRGEEVDWKSPEVRAVVDALGDIALELKALGHSHAYLDANARYFIARHLVAVGLVSVPR